MDGIQFQLFILSQIRIFCSGVQTAKKIAWKQIGSNQIWTVYIFGSDSARYTNQTATRIGKQLLFDWRLTHS